MHSCWQYENAVCCSDSAYCCPSDYPICDIEEGLCLRVIKHFNSCEYVLKQPFSDLSYSFIRRVLF